MYKKSNVTNSKYAKYRLNNANYRTNIRMFPQLKTFIKRPKNADWNVN